jgi:glycine/D-amino acid oxidase-like deaminating enzyme
MKKFDITVVGNGMIGVLTSFLLKNKYPKKKICLIGNKYFKNSASTAAGAMHAVFCEIEKNFYESKLEQSNFELGLKSRKLWKEIFKKYNLNDAITSKDTLFYIKHKSSDFEKNNFEIACEVANKYKVLNKTSKNELEKNFSGYLKQNEMKCFKIKNEFSFNPTYLMTKLLNLSKKNNMDLINEDINSVVFKGKKYLINDKYLADKLIITGGYNSHEIAKNLFEPVPIVKGVGTAFILKNDYFKNLNSVIRTSNRGGQQCGLHLVPYNQKKGEVYIGAGNFISPDDEPWARTETIRYLINLLEDELIPKSVIYYSTIKPLLGYRPRSIDNTPSIGPVSDTLFYVSGTNRVGLSWAPSITHEIMNWLEHKKNDSLLDQYKPNRAIKSWGKIDDACTYYASSRLSNLMEHNLVKTKKSDLKQKFNELYKFANNKNTNFNKKFNFKKDFAIDPDCYSYFDKLKKF